MSDRKTKKKSTYKTTKRDIERAFSGKFVESLEKAIALSESSWKNPCLFSQGQSQGPYNYYTGKSYDGANVFMLAVTQLLNGYSDGAWMTYNQIAQLAEKTKKNIHVIAGEKSTEIIFWKKSVKVYEPEKEETTDDEEEGEEEDTDNEEKEENIEKKEFRVLWLLKSYRVFNVAQIEWDGYDYSKKLKKQSAKEYDEVALATMDSARDFLTRNYKNGAPAIQELPIETNCYMPAFDLVKMCPRASFRSPEVFFSTLAHELGHSTGVEKRLNRKISNKFGSDPYAKEELVAETTALMCCASVGLLSTYENSVAYLKSWLKHVKENADSIVWAYKEASKATSWILGLEDGKSEE